MKKTSRYPANLPISRKAYNRFINRIISVFADDPEGLSEMIATFDAYLTDPSAQCSLSDQSMRVAFAFLRQEIDLAIERSRRARQRAIDRKASASPTTVHDNTSIAPATDPETYTPTSTEPNSPISTEAYTTSTEANPPASPNTTPKSARPAPNGPYRKNTRSASAPHSSRRSTRKRKLKLHKSPRPNK